MENFEFNTKPKSPAKKSFAFGILILLFGLALLLRNMNILSGEMREMVFSWEMLIIVIGVVNVFDRNRWFGLTMIGIGTMFLIGNFFDLPITLRTIFWPTLIILLGFGLIFGRTRKFRDKIINVSTSKEDEIDLVSVFGGGERTITTHNFMGGRITAVFGGAEVNMLNAKLADGVNVLDVTCLFGGVEIIVPADWNIRMEMMHILGGTSDKNARIDISDTSKTLVIKGLVMFGGTEIKRF